MMRKKRSVMVAIPAYNEQETIASVLSAVLEQQQKHYTLNKILIVTDGCTDDTVSVISTIADQHHNIECSIHKKRKGKVRRLNEIFAKVTSDILVVLDADIRITSKSFIDGLVLAHVKEPKVAVVVAHQIPIKPETFIGKIIHAGYLLWDKTRLSVPQADHIQNFYGAATAYKGSFASQIKIPTNVTDETGYLYLLAKQYGGFKYSFQNVIYYWPVTTLHDFFKLGDRSFMLNQKILASIFGQSVYEEYFIDRIHKIKAIISSLMENPVFTMLSIVLNIWARVFPTHDELYNQGMWEISTSSKRPITKKDLQ